MVLILLLKNNKSIKISNANISFESRSSIKNIRESDIQEEVSYLSSKKSRTFENIPKIPKDISDTCNSVL